jgi:hypothetical protein
MAMGHDHVPAAHGHSNRCLVLGGIPRTGPTRPQCLGLLLGALLQESLYPEADAERTQESGLRYHLKEIMREDLV